MEEGQGFMALEEYVRKRKFEKTPEPPPKTKAGETAAAGAAPRFYVQRHDATRLHYDFRLEIGGVLVSWAVPKGPSLEPLSKFLAAKVEDHPLEYGEFEGNIPGGTHGACGAMLWDRGSWELLGDAPVEQPGMSLKQNKRRGVGRGYAARSEEHTSELQSLRHLVC